jgi:hypothetical protein
MNTKVKDLWDQAKAMTDQGSANVDLALIEVFAALIIDGCTDAVIESDPSEKRILHEPYRTVMNNIMEVFYEFEDQDEVEGDNRHVNCRERLRQEGHPYPKSGCNACGGGLLHTCPHEDKNVV